MTRPTIWPHCGCQRVRKSRSGNRYLFLIRYFLVCVRCHGCCRKFYRRASAVAA